MTYPSVSIYKAQGDNPTQVRYDSSLNLSIPPYLKCIAQLQNNTYIFPFQAKSQNKKNNEAVQHIIGFCPRGDRSRGHDPTVPQRDLDHA